MSEASPDDVPRKIRERQRARKACEPCRERKRKCDGTEPCSVCQGYKYTCYYSERKKRRRISSAADTDGHTLSNLKNGNGVSSHTNGEGPPKCPPIIRQEGSVLSGGSVLDPATSRYMEAHSAVAFPRSLGIDLKSTNPPRLHSFAWNMGVRPETPVYVSSKIAQIISLEELKEFSATFFTIVHPTHGFIDRAAFDEHSTDSWFGLNRGVDYEAVVCGVVALGSFFSASGNMSKEAELVRHIKAILNSVEHTPTLNHVSAWILYCLYLRGTTRPHAAWQASCTAVHVAEALGLHQEYDSVAINVPKAPRHPSSEDLEMRRRTFWMVWTVNALVSYEYGRSRVFLEDIGCHLPTSIPGSTEDSSIHLINLVQLLPQNPLNRTVEEKKDALVTALHLTAHINDAHPLLRLIKAELALCVYRRLRILVPGVANEQIGRIIALGQPALQAARDFAQQKIPWWQALSVPFQYICVLLAADTQESLTNLGEAVEGFEEIVACFQTHMALEALQTIRTLVQLARAKKQKELGLLGGQSAVAGPASVETESVSEVFDAAALADTSAWISMPSNLEEWGVNWDHFLDPTFAQL